MGYRSDVRAHVYPARVTGDPDNTVAAADGYARLKVIMNTTYKEFMEYWEENFVWNDNNQFLDFSMNYVKWYDNYPEIKTFMSFLDEIAELDFQYEFIRLGEDSNDVETQASVESDGLLQVRRDIVSEWD
jgi:hypothetical protein